MDGFRLLKVDAGPPFGWVLVSQNRNRTTFWMSLKGKAKERNPPYLKGRGVGVPPDNREHRTTNGIPGVTPPPPLPFSRGEDAAQR